MEVRIMPPPNGFVHVDLTGLDEVPMHDAPVVESQDHAARLLQQALDRGFSIAGMRHSQGGQTALKDGRMLITEALSRVGTPSGSGSPNGHIDVEAGAVWSAVHRRISPVGLATQVQQSSAQFSIGGSLAVNCHGREVRWGTVSQSVESITVLDHRGRLIKASPTDNLEIWRTVLGGYGAGAMIVSARLRLTTNDMLQRYMEPCGLSDYQILLQSVDDRTFDSTYRPSQGPLQLHHGWLNCTERGYLDDVLVYNARRDKPMSGVNGAVVHPYQLRTEGWGTSELLRAGWVAARLDNDFRKFVWTQLKHKTPATLGPLSRLDFLREEIMFTSSQADAKGVDLLQEYFVPVPKLAQFVRHLREDIFPYDARGKETGISLQSCTVRYVRGDTLADGPLLSYCPGQARAAVAIDAHVGRTPHGDLKPEAVKRFGKAIALTLMVGGTFYLPYRQFATLDQIREGFKGFDDWRQEVRRIDPDKRFYSEFLRNCGV
jgi:decaprenylphospho-beta-D-ribofuranose 2-oxidase